ncbi:MAG: hypothetical protein QW134_08630 [Nitrososphaeria archaeon]
MSNISKDRCWICGAHMPLIYRSRNYIPYICFWCAPYEVKKNFGGGEKYHTYELVCDLINEAEANLKENNLVNCESIPPLSLLADIGEFGSAHPYTKPFTRMIATIILQVSRSRTYNILSLFRFATGDNLVEKLSRVNQCISFMCDVGLLEMHMNTNNVYSPSGLLINIAPIVEADSKVELGHPSRVADCIFGYAFLKGIKLTVDWLVAGAMGEPKGFIKIYPDKGRIIPISFTAPLSYLLGSLTVRETFSQGEMRAWLADRKIYGKDADIIVGWLGRMVPAHHRLVDLQHDPYDYRFIFNSEYIRMRERFRERWRSR